MSATKQSSATNGRRVGLFATCLVDLFRPSAGFAAVTLLEQAGYEVIGEASNGKEAVEKFHELKPDVTTMDIVMPLQSGIEAVRALRADAAVGAGADWHGPGLEVVGVRAPGFRDARQGDPLAR